MKTLQSQILNNPSANPYIHTYQVVHTFDRMDMNTFRKKVTHQKVSVRSFNGFAGAGDS